MSLPQFTHLSFSGGGMSGLCYMGIIHYMQLHDLHKSILYVSGTSVGSIFALMFTMELSSEKMLMYLENHIQTDEFRKIDGKALLELIHKKGIDNGERIIIPIRKILKDIYDVNDITFIELAKKTGRHLIICATCIETGKPFYFSVDTTPNVSVIEAIRASIAVPLIFQPVEINGKHYVDGAVSQNHPIDVFGNPPPNSCLAIRCIDKPKPIETVPESFLPFLQRILTTFFLHADKEYTKCKHYILLDENPLQFFDTEYVKPNIYLKLSKEDLENSIYYGFLKAHQFFSAFSISLASSLESR